MNIIEVSNLKKEYKYKVKDKGRGFLYNLFNEKTKSLSAVNDISLSIKKGETVAFIGPNGAGKSTTIKMLTGILYPTKGTIKVCGLTLTVINFYICLIVTISFLIQIFMKKIKLSFDIKSIGVFIGAGIPASIFNFCLIQGYLLAPNPGYISAANVASIAVLTVLYRIFFKDALTLKKSIGIIGILIGLFILFI